MRLTCHPAFSVIVLMLVCVALGSQAATPPTLSNPNVSPEVALGPVYAGALVGKAAVSAGGNATYSIPVIVPPGTSGVQPGISINYNSNMRNGLLGLGWFLQGVTSHITRCPQTKVQDGQIKAVNYTSADRFCLDGNRLLAVAGSYGASGTEYRTESDSFSRIISHGAAGNGPAYFTVESKGGKTTYYGNTADSANEAHTRSDIRAWALNRVEDRVGNYYSIEYYESSDSKTHYPIKVGYTGNDTEGLLPNAEVIFTYADRLDDDHAFMGGYEYRPQSKRLTGIESYVGGQRVSDYRLTYEEIGSNDRSRITKIERCDDSGTCQDPVELAWKENGDGYQFYDLSISDYQGGEADINFPRWHDFNGDGRPDYVNPPYNSSPTAYYSNKLYTELKIALSVPGGYTTEIWDLALDLKTTDIIWTDINGDGRTDLAVENQSGNLMSYDIFFSNGSGFSHEIWTGHSIGSSSDKEEYYFRDMNGDGLLDLVARERSTNSSQSFVSCTGVVATWYMRYYTYYVHLNTGTGFGSKEEWLSSTEEASYLGDFNGDGLADVIEKTRYVHLNSGQGFETAVDWGTYGTFGCNSNTYGASYNDVNSDGLIDRVSNNHIQLNTGSSFKDMGYATQFPNSNFDGSAGGDQYYRSYNAYSGKSSFGIRLAEDDYLGSTDPLLGFSYFGFNQFMQPADVDGDGIQELTIAKTYKCKSGDGHGYYLAKFCENGTIRVYDADAKNLQLLEKITSGLGKEVVFTYKPISDGAYKKYNDAILPEVDVQNGTQVVSKIERSNGVGGIHTTKYWYEGLKYDISGRGNLGFAKIISTDIERDTKTVTKYAQTFPYSMQPTVVKVVRKSSNQLISRTTNTYSVHGTVGSGPVFPYVDTRVSESYDLADGRLLSSSTTTNHCDAYGNVTDTTVLTEDFENNSTHELQTLNSFSVDTVSWRLAQLTSKIEKFSINGAHNPALDRRFDFTYQSGSGLLKDATQEQGAGAALEITKSLTYDGFGNITSETVSGPTLISRTSTIAYDSRGQFALTVTNPLGHQLSRTWEGKFGNKLSETDLNGQTTTWAYNTFGQPETQINPDGTSSQTKTYLDNSGGNGMALAYTETIASGAAPTRVFFDILGRKVRSRTQGFQGSYVNQDVDYDALGRAYRTSEPYFAGDTVYWSTLTFDWAGRENNLSAADPATSKTVAYDGYKVTVTDLQNQSSSQTSNALGQVVEVVDRQSTVSRFSYDAAGNRVEAKNAVGSPKQNSVTYTYDRLGRQLSQIDPDHGTYTYEYNALGERTKEVSPKMAASGQSMLLQYDQLGRMTNRTEPEGTTTYIYDNTTSGNLGTGQIHSESFGTFTRTYAYASGNYGRLTGTATVIDATTYSTSRSYDSLGRVTTETYPTSPGAPTGFTVEYQYNDIGLLERVQAPGGTAAYYQLIAADASGRITEEWKGDGSWFSQSYEAQSGRIVSQHTLNGALTMQHFSYTYDASGNMTNRSDMQYALSENFTFDALDRLTSAQVGASPMVNYDFDVIGNITQKSDKGSLFEYTTSAVHAVTQITAGTSTLNMSYDSNGNLTSGNDAPSITWASYNKPTQVAKGVISYDFKYGPDRKRYQRKRNNIRTDYVGSSFEQTYHVGSTEYRHVIRANGKAIMLRKEQGGTISHEYIHRDHLGSVTLLTRESDGSVIESYSYDAWGMRRSSGDWGSPVASTLEHRGYTGHEHLDDVGIIHMNGRIYDPALGRMLSPDPVTQAPENGQNYNRYTYAYNNPLKYTDPSGYSTQARELGSGDGGGAGEGFSGYSQVFSSMNFLVELLQAKVEATKFRLEREAGRSPRDFGRPSIQIGDELDENGNVVSFLTTFPYEETRPVFDENGLQVIEQQPTGTFVQKTVTVGVILPGSQVAYPRVPVQAVYGYELLTDHALIEVYKRTDTVLVSYPENRPLLATHEVIESGAWVATGEQSWDNLGTNHSVDLSSFRVLRICTVSCGIESAIEELMGGAIAQF